MNVTGVYLWLHAHAPWAVRNTLQRFVGNTPFGNWIRRAATRHPWPMKGHLEGHFLRIQTPDQQQYIFDQRETEVTHAITALVKPGWVCVDAGAHIGYFTLLLAKLVGPEGRVVAFEADQSNADLLRLNVSLNGYEDRVKVEHSAVSDGSRDSVALYSGPSSFEASILPQSDSRVSEVPATSLDRYFRRGERLDIVKMDIEGGETKAIPGMRRLLLETRPLLLIEVHERCWQVVENVLSFDYLPLDTNFVPMPTLEERQRLHHCIAIPVEKYPLVPLRNR